MKKISINVNENYCFKLMFLKKKVFLLNDILHENCNHLKNLFLEPDTQEEINSASFNLISKLSNQSGFLFKRFLKKDGDRLQETRFNI
jgi:hypothetical protein